MVEINAFREIALSFPEASEKAHFDKTAFTIGEKVFVTLNERLAQATVKLTVQEQDLFSLFDKTVIYPVPNSWGKKGWTIIELRKVEEQTLRDALTSAYRTTAPKRLASQF